MRISTDSIRFFKQGLKFLFVIIAMDLLFGFFAEWIYFNQKTGKGARLTYAINETKDDILVFGSSHANRHYDTRVLSDKLGMSSYNTGVQGQKMIFSMALQQMIMDRYQPKLILLNLDADWMFYSETSYNRLSDLYPYYWDHRQVLKPVLSLDDRFIDLKMLVNTYRYNSTFIHALKYKVSPQRDYNGFHTIDGTFSMKHFTGLDMDEQPKPIDRKIDSNCVQALRKFISNARRKNVKLCLLISPAAYARGDHNDQSVKKMKELAEESQVKFLDLSNDERFVGKDELFFDMDHLNTKGAAYFTSIVCDTLLSSGGTIIK